MLPLAGLCADEGLFLGYHAIAVHNELVTPPAVTVRPDHGDILIDLILPDGRIVPAEISILDSTENLSTIKADYAVRITLYNSPGNYYNVLFDRDRNIVGKTENERENYELKRTGVENIIEVFNDRKADIEKMLKNT